MVLQSSQKKTNFIKYLRILLSVKFRSIPFCGFREDVKNISAIRGQGDYLAFPISPKNTMIIEDIETLLPVKYR